MAKICFVSCLASSEELLKWKLKGKFFTKSIFEFVEDTT